MNAQPLSDAQSALSVVVQRAGDSDVLAVEERHVGSPGADDLLVEVAAGGVNFIDIYQRNGVHAMDYPFVAGLEGAGTVLSVGADVTDFEPGDRVAWAMVPGSGYSTHAVVPAASVVPVPGGVSLEDAAAVMLQGLTAHYLASSTYPAQAGETALVHAGAGGVGLLLTQLLTHRGVRVLTTASSEVKAELSRGAGAAEVIRYDEVDFADEVFRLTDGYGLPVVYDGVGFATYERSLKCLRPRGLLALFGAASGPVPPIDPRALELGGSLFLTRPTLKHHIQTRDELVARTDEIFGLIADGALNVRIGGTYSLHDAARAQDDLAGRRTTGKVLILPAE